MPRYAHLIAARPWYKKLGHGVLGFFSGLVVGPYAALKRALKFYRYVFSRFTNTWSFGLAVLSFSLPLAGVTLAYMVGFALYGMGRGAFIGYQYAVYTMRNVQEVFSFTTYVYRESSASLYQLFELNYARSYLYDRFGMYEYNSTWSTIGRPVVRVVNFLYNDNPVEQKLAKGYFDYLKQEKQLALSHKNFMRYWEFAAKQYTSAYWETIRGPAFREYLQKTHQYDQKVLECLRIYGLTIDNFITVAPAVDNWHAAKYKESFSIILAMCTIPDLTIRPMSPEGKKIRTHTSVFLDYVQTQFKPRQYPCHAPELLMLLNPEKQLDFTISYMFTGRPVYPADEKAILFEQSLYQLVQNYPHVFSGKALSACMFFLIEHYLKFLLTTSNPLPASQESLCLNIVTAIVLCFQNDTVDVALESIHPLVEAVEAHLPAQMQSFVYVDDENSRNTGRAILQASKLPPVLIHIIAGYRGTLMHEQELRRERKEIKLAASKDYFFYNISVNGPPVCSSISLGPPG